MVNVSFIGFRSEFLGRNIKKGFCRTAAYLRKSIQRIGLNSGLPLIFAFADQKLDLPHSVTPDIKQAWESRTKVEWEGGTLSVVSPEGLILLKSFRRSGQDQDDIEYLRSIIDED